MASRAGGSEEVAAEEVVYVLRPFVWRDNISFVDNTEASSREASPVSSERLASANGVNIRLKTELIGMLGDVAVGSVPTKVCFSYTSVRAAASTCAIVVESSSEGIGEGAGKVVDLCCPVEGSLALEAGGSENGTLEALVALPLEASWKVRGSPSTVLRDLEGVEGFLCFLLFGARSGGAALSDIFWLLGGAEGPLLPRKSKIIPSVIGEYDISQSSSTEKEIAIKIKYRKRKMGE